MEHEEYCFTRSTDNYVFCSYKKTVLNKKPLLEIFPSLLKSCLQNNSSTTCSLCLAMLMVALQCLLYFSLKKKYYTYSGDPYAKKDELVSRWVDELAVSFRRYLESHISVLF